MLKQFFALSAVIAVFSGCAAINKQGYAQEIEIRSLPSNATLELVDHTSGERKVLGKTPISIDIKKEGGFMKSRRYSIILAKEGYKTREFALDADVNGYYSWGNLLGAGPIGWAIVDPVTGAMWEYKAAKAEYVINTEGGIEVMLEDDVAAQKALRKKK